MSWFKFKAAVGGFFAKTWLVLVAIVSTAAALWFGVETRRQRLAREQREQTIADNEKRVEAQRQAIEIARAELRAAQARLQRERELAEIASHNRAAVAQLNDEERRKVEELRRDPVRLAWLLSQ